MEEDVWLYWLNQSEKYGLKVVHVPHFKSKNDVDKFIKLMIVIFEEETDVSR